MISGISERWIEIGVAVAIMAAVGLVGGLLTEVGPWYEGLRFPSWRPPNWLFGPAWTVIYIFIACSGIVAWEHAPDAAARKELLELLAINIALNVAWSPLFFKLRRPDWALAELIVFWLSIAVLVGFILMFSPFAAALMAPYLGWVTFAGWLNWTVVKLNRPFGVNASGD